MNCEFCDNFECTPGSKPSSNPQHCQDCTVCSETLPVYAQWLYRCEFECMTGYVLANVTSVDADGISIMHCGDHLFNIQESWVLKVNKLRHRLPSRSYFLFGLCEQMKNSARI